MSEIVAGSRVMVRIEAEAEDHDWPDDCASFADVFGDIDGPDDGFEAGTVIRVDEDGAVPVALVVWDGLADASEDADGDGMPAVWAWRVPCFALMPHGSCRSRWERLVDPVRQIATIIGCPASADPLTDLDGLVSMVRATSERAETVRVVTADRDALRAELDKRIAPHCQHAADPGHDIGHGVHPDRVGPSVLDAEIERLTVERDRRIDPVEHARAVMTASLNGYGYGCGADSEAMFVWKNIATDRSRLLARVGADVLAIVEES